MNEKENCRMLIISGQRALIVLGLELNKKLNYFPQLRRWYMRSHNFLTFETSDERADKINAVISYELRYKVNLATFFLHWQYNFSGLSFEMHERITNAADEIREWGNTDDYRLFWDYSRGDEDEVHYIQACYHKYAKERKESGFNNKVISKIFL